MSSFSILNNAAAASALFNLNRTQSSLNAVQEHINTGLKIGSAKDNASTYAVSLGMKNDVAGYKSIRDTIALGKGTVQVAMDTADSVSELVERLKAKVVEAQSENVDRAALQDEINQIRSQIDTIVGTAQLNGVNLVGDVDAAGAGKKMKVLASLDRTSASEAPTPRFIEVAHQDLTTAKLGKSDKTGSLASINVNRPNLDQKAAIEKLNINSTDDFAANDTVSVDVKDAEGRVYRFTLSAVAAAGDVGQNDFVMDDLGTLQAAFADDSNIVGVRMKYDTDGKTLIVDTDNATDTITWSATGLEGATVSTAVQITDTNEGTGFNLVGATVTAATAANHSVSSTSFDADPNSLLIGFESSVMTFKDNAGAASALVATDVVTLTLYKQSGEKITLTASAAGDEDEIAAGLQANAVSQNIDLNELGVTISTNATDSTLTVTSTGKAGGVAIGGLSVSNPTAADALIAQGKVSVENTRGFAQSLAGEIDKVEQAVQQLKTASALFGSIANRLDLQDQFLESLTNNLNDGISSLIDANMAEESAKFQALQVQQQLGLQALSIANQAPQAVLSLFR